MTLERWVDELEMLEALDRGEETRAVVVRMGRLAREGRLQSFREVVRDDGALDAGTKAWVLRMARNEDFPVAAYGYAERLGHRRLGGATMAARAGD